MTGDAPAEPADRAAHLDYPPEIRAALARGRRIEWWAIAWTLSIIAVMGVVMGGSQAMRTAWVEDCLSLLPPALFLVATTVEGRPASRRFPYGFHRAASLAFFGAAATLLALGLILAWGSAVALLTHERPSIGSMRIGGQEVWIGWVMMLAMVYSIVPQAILGRMKGAPAAILHDKVLATDAEMGSADWQTGVAGLLGIAGIAFGLWWADALAAGLIALSIVKDGLGACRTAMAELIDGAPRRLDGSGLADEALVLADRARGMGARLKLRETGRLITGVLESRDPGDLATLTEGMGWRVRGISWLALDTDDLDGPGRADGPVGRRPIPAT